MYDVTTLDNRQLVDKLLGPPGPGHQPALVEEFLRRCGKHANPHLGDEVTEKLLATVWEKLLEKGGLRHWKGPASSFGGWIRTVFNNALRDQQRSRDTDLAFRTHSVVKEDGEEVQLADPRNTDPADAAAERDQLESQLATVGDAARKHPLLGPIVELHRRGRSLTGAARQHGMTLAQVREILRHILPRDPNTGEPDDLAPGFVDAISS